MPVSSLASGIVELERGEALLGGLLQILHQALVAGIVGNHQLEIGVRFEQLALLVQRQGAAVVGQRVDHHGGVLARFDDFIQIADRADARGGGQRAIQPARAVGFEQIAADQIGGGHVFVAGHGDQRLVQFPGHVFDEARFAAAGRAFDHHRQARGIGGFVERHFVALRLVERFLVNLVLVFVGHHFLLYPHEACSE